MKRKLSKHQKSMRTARLARKRYFQSLLDAGYTLEEVGTMNGKITKQAVLKVMRP